MTSKRRKRSVTDTPQEGAELTVVKPPGPAGKNRDLEFHPIKMKGEPLSATILRERR